MTEEISAQEWQDHEDEHQLELWKDSQIEAALEAVKKRA